MALPAGRRGIRANLVKSDGTIGDLTDIKEDITDIKEDITELNNNLTDSLNGVRLVPFTKKVTLPAGTVGNPTTTQVSLAEFIPSGWTIKTIIAQLGVYLLPYVGTFGNNNSPLTWIEFVYNNSGLITIKNSATDWTNYELIGVLLLVRA